MKKISLSEKLQQFSLLDIALVKIVYLFNVSNCSIIVIYFLFDSSYIQKARKSLKTNKPSYQVLLFFSMFFFACMLAVLIPALH